jgi:hypothetical protein
MVDDLHRVRVPLSLLVSIEIARQRRVNLFNLRPVNSGEMARARQLRLDEIKMGEVILEIIIYVFFTVILLFLSYQSRDTNSYAFYRDTKNLFITDDFYDVNSIGTWWDYCDNVLLQGLYAQPWYNNKSLTWREKLTTGSRVSMRVGAPRIRQLRVKDNSCRVHRRVKHVITNCRDDYNWIDDDTKDYGTGWTAIINQTVDLPTDSNVTETKRCRTPWCYQVSGDTSSLARVRRDRPTTSLITRSNTMKRIVVCLRTVVVQSILEQHSNEKWTAHCHLQNIQRRRLRHRIRTNIRESAERSSRTSCTEMAGSIHSGSDH